MEENLIILACVFFFNNNNDNFHKKRSRCKTTKSPVYLPIFQQTKNNLQRGYSIMNAYTKQVGTILQPIHYHKSLSKISRKYNLFSSISIKYQIYHFILGVSFWHFSCVVEIFFKLKNIIIIIFSNNYNSKIRTGNLKFDHFSDFWQSYS